MSDVAVYYDSIQLEILFDVHASALLRYFLHRTGGDLPRAEDLVQEVFLSAVKSARSNRQTLLTGAWLYTVAHRRLSDDLRGRLRSPLTVPIDETSHPTEFAPFPDHVGSNLVRIVDDLPRPQRLVFIERVLEGRPFREIAIHLGSSEGAARMHLVRALQTVRAQLLEVGIG